MREEQKNLKWSAILLAILDILLGVVALVVTEELMDLVVKLIGWGVIVAGVLSILAYLVRDVRINIFRNDFVNGLILIVVGVVILRSPDLVKGLIPTAFGLLVIFSGCTKLQSAIDLKRLKVGNWAGMLVASILNLILGVVVIIYAKEVATVMFKVLGIGLILSGLSDLISTIYLSRKLAKFEKAIRNAAFEEVPPAPQPPHPQEPPRP